MADETHRTDIAAGLGDFIDRLSAGILVAGPDANLRAVNQAAARMLGARKEECLRSGSYDPQWQLYREDGSPCPPHERPIPSAIARRRAVRNAVVRVSRAATGHSVWLRVDAEPRLAPDGSVSEVVCTLVDVTEAKAAAEREQRLRELAEALQGAMALTTADLGEVLYVSPGYERIWGRSRESLYRNPRSWVDAVHPEDLEAVQEAIEKVRHGEPAAVEHRVMRPDGSVLWVSHTAAPVRDREGRVYRFAGTVLDITARKRAEEALRKSEARLRALVQGAPAVLWTVDRSLRFTSGAGAALGPLGLREDQLNGMHVFDYLHDESVVEAHRQVLEGEKVRFDYAWQGRDFHVILRPLRENGGISGAIGVAIDITERKRAERDALEWKRRYDAAVDATGQILYDFDARSGEVTCSGNLESILGYSSAEMAGGAQRWMELIHPDDRERFREEVERGLATGAPLHLRYRVRHKQGRYVEVQDDGSYIRDEQGRVTEAIGFVTDLTERRGLEEQLQQAQKMEAVGQLAGGVAHEFNNLLTVILGYADAVRDGVENAAALAGIAEIEKAAERAGSLTRQLLAFGRRQLLRPMLLDLNTLVAGATPEFRALAGEKIEMRTVLPAGIGRVNADPAQVREVLRILIANARDAMPDGGMLTIETANVDLEGPYIGGHLAAGPGPYVMLAVSDTGKGMDLKTQARIFEPFFTTKGVGEGTGLGLATVYGTVRQSGGAIWVYSEPGRGTAFKIYLPRIEAPAAPARTGERPGLARGTETVLVIEQEDALRGLIETILRAAGYTVMSVAGPAEALEACHGRRIPLMIADVVLPGISGREVAEHLRRECPGIKALYLSGYTDEGIGQYPPQSGAAFLAKPFSAAALAAKVREVLDAG